MTALIDAHLHLWDIGSGGYGWLTPEAGPLYATFDAAMAEQELRAAAVTGAVLVQADDTDADTDAMLAVADVHTWVAGVVGWLPLDDPERAERRLAELRLHPAFCGVRHLVHDDPRRGFLDLPTVRRSLRLLAQAGLAFDVPNAWPHHLGQTVDIADDVADLVIVIDHLAKPPRGREDFDDWRAEFRRAASRPNTVAKVSGLRAPGAAYSVGALREVWETTLEAFGPERMMWGSDWPVTVPEGGYAPTFAVLMSLIDELAPAERDAVRRRTASRVYRLR
ncbi:amidohydrolase family protein [Microbacterium neimengense]